MPGTARIQDLLTPERFVLRIAGPIDGLIKVHVSRGPQQIAASIRGAVIDNHEARGANGPVVVKERGQKVRFVMHQSDDGRFVIAQGSVRLDRDQFGLHLSLVITEPDGHPAPPA